MDRTWWVHDYGTTAHPGELPSLSKLYVNAAATAARRRVMGFQAATALPHGSHEVRGVRADVANLTAYQHLIGETASDALPAGFIHALAFPVAMSVLNRDDFPLPLLGMIHLKNHVEQLRAVQFSEPLDVRSWAEHMRGHRAGTQLDVVAEVRSSNGGPCSGAASRRTSPRGLPSGSRQGRRGRRSTGVQGARTNRRLAARSGYRPPVRRRIRGLQSDPLEPALGQGVGPAAVDRARHVPCVPGLG